MKTFLPLAFLFFTQLIFCQYDPLESDGDIPNDFITYSYQKYEKELEKVDRKSKRRTRKNQK